MTFEAASVVSEPLGPQSEAADVSALCCGSDRSWRAQKRAADGLAESGADYDQLHHFVGAGLWDEAPLERELLVQADGLVGGADAVLVFDDTALPKKGKQSVGVAAQYRTVLGKHANWQTLRSVP